MFRLLRNLLFASPEDRRLMHYLVRYLGVRPNRPELYRQALRHGSAVPRGATGTDRSNERLEFLGDAVLDSIVAQFLFEQYDELSEGELTKLKSKVVSRRMLNQLGRELKVETMLETRMGSQPIQPALIGNALEALIGAVYLDKGYRKTEAIVLKLLRDYRVNERIQVITDYKSKLHEYCQKHRKSLNFVVVREKQDIEGSYEVQVHVGEKAMGKGSGASKKSAEQAAAFQACRRIFGNEE